MKTTTALLLLIALSTPIFGKKETVMTAAQCDEIHVKLDTEQYKYHDTLSLMMNELRESSTPDTLINSKKVKKYLDQLGKNKKEMNNITKSSKYSNCFL
jgi:hypothetical protein